MKATILLLGVLFVAADDGRDAIKKDMALLDGSWSMVSGTNDGIPLPRIKVRAARRVAKDGESTVTAAGKVFAKATYTIDPSKKPKTIDYVMTDGPTKGKTQLGIYEFEGDTVKICFASPDKARPTDFTSKPGSGNTLAVWQREKK